MSSRPLKFLQLRQKCIDEIHFLNSISKARTNKQLKKLLQKASDQQTRILQNILISHFDKQGVLIEERSISKVKKAKKLRFLEKAFRPTRKLNPLREARLLLIKCIPILKLFVKNFLE